MNIMNFNLKDYFSIKKVKNTTSTNSLIKKFEKTEKPFQVIYSNFQTEGRGQKGNKWESQAGKNLLMSISYSLDLTKDHYFIPSIIISLAVRKALISYTKEITIKWPNDIYWEQYKIGGILIENDMNASTITHSIIGIGLNINQDQFHSGAPNPYSLKLITNEEYSIEHILNKVLYSFVLYTKKYQKEGPALLLEEYKETLFRKTGYHSYRDKNGLFHAKFLDILLNGQIILEDSKGEQRNYYFKEVEYIF